MSRARNTPFYAATILLLLTVSACSLSTSKPEMSNFLAGISPASFEEIYPRLLLVVSEEDADFFLSSFVIQLVPDASNADRVATAFFFQVQDHSSQSDENLRLFAQIYEGGSIDIQVENRPVYQGQGELPSNTEGIMDSREAWKVFLTINELYNFSEEDFSCASLLLLLSRRGEKTPSVWRLVVSDCTFENASFFDIDARTGMRLDP